MLNDEGSLLARCETIQGLSFSQLASSLNLRIPETPLKRKGWLGMAIELALGAEAGNQSLPDFPKIGIELKTLPLSQPGIPFGSTFVTSIPLLNIYQQSWSESTCYAKLKRVLWVPVESQPELAFAHRRIGQAFLWSPSKEDEAILASDWEELAFMVSSGQLEQIHAGLGTYLQVRPKAANSRSLCQGLDEKGNIILTLPRGFYLRSLFTKKILSEQGLI